MKLVKRILVTSIVMVLAISAFGYFFWYKPKFSHHPHNNSFAVRENRRTYNYETMLRLRQKAFLAKDFVNDHGYNLKHCFLLDMRLSSGKNRFFVYNLEKDSVEIAGLVTHGSGSGKGGNELYFSNIPNSNCTSLGKYKIGKSYRGNFGLAYKLYGLDNTNNKAFERFVVLHSHSCVPNNEVAPFTICESWGCPTVAPAFFGELKKYLDGSRHPVLLWIYY